MIAEGIETERHLTQLHWLGCDAGQGSYFARPIPSEDLLDFLTIQIPRWSVPAVTECHTECHGDRKEPFS
ncbi:hypothetical protein NON20_16355 [Synechocystis sp. B12]|nr:hypothetical protein NON20_16355 [Synechocystis sp. B12]